MKITTWNINGVRARIEGAVAYVREAKPDVLCFQEIKCQDEGFPTEAFTDLGYSVVTHGQKGFNGVALLSLHPLEDVVRGLPGDDTDVQSRYIEATVTHGDLSVRVASIYLPNGNPIDTPKFPYKLAWMKRLEAHARQLLGSEMPVVLGGDFNVIPEPQDAKRPAAWVNDALFQPESRSAFRALGNLGYVEAVRTAHPEPGLYTFWDYQAGAWQKDDGIRIDFQMLSPQAADRWVASGIDRFTRSWEKPSDHVPVWTELA